MNKKILSVLGTSILSLTLTTQVALAAEPIGKDNMQLNYSTRSQANPQQIVNFAKQQVGKGYVSGAEGPNTFDCSGFIYYVFSQNGYDISRTSVASYWRDSSIKKVSNPKAGDLIFFKGTYGGDNHPSHIGIMINSTQFVHAANENDGVIITDISSPYWNRHLLGYKRLISDEAPAPNPTDGTFGTAYINVHEGWGVNTYDGPNGNYKGVVHGGESYVVYEYKDGYYDLGNSTWVREDYVKFHRDVAYVNVHEGWGVNTYDGPNGNYKGVVHGGESYVVYAYKDGYYDLGNSTWVKGDYLQIHRTY